MLRTLTIFWLANTGWRMWPIFFFSGGRVVSSPHRPAFDLWMARSLGDCYFRWAIEPARYLFAPCKGNRNAGKFCLWNPESWVCNPEYAQEIRNPTNDWNPESKFYRQILKSSTWNPESKTILDPLIWSESLVFTEATKWEMVDLIRLPGYLSYHWMWTS